MSAIGHVLRTLERVTRPPRLGHDVDVPLTTDVATLSPAASAGAAGSGPAAESLADQPAAGQPVLLIPESALSELITRWQVRAGEVSDQGYWTAGDQLRAAAFELTELIKN